MEGFLAIVLLLNLIISLLAVLKTDAGSSKMLVTILFSTTGVAFLLLLYGMEGRGYLLDIALAFIVLSTVTGAVFAKRIRYINDGL